MPKRSRLSRGGLKPRSKRLDRNLVRIGVLLHTVAEDFDDYYYNVAETPAERLKYKKLAEKAYTLAERISGKSSDWLGDVGFMTYMDKSEQEDLGNLHSTDILFWAEEEAGKVNLPASLMKELKSL